MSGPGRVIRGRLAAVSVRASFGAGAWVGFALGLVLGALFGALITWFVGAVLDWQRQLAFSLGIANTLLPFGDQIPALQWLSDTWYLVIPVTALIVGGISALVGGVIGAFLAAAYNRSPRHASVVVELAPAGSEATPDEPVAPGAP